MSRASRRGATSAAVTNTRSPSSRGLMGMRWFASAPRQRERALLSMTHRSWPDASRDYVDARKYASHIHERSAASDNVYSVRSGDVQVRDITSRVVILPRGKREASA